MFRLPGAEAGIRKARRPAPSVGAMPGAQNSRLLDGGFRLSGRRDAGRRPNSSCVSRFCRHERTEDVQTGGFRARFDFGCPSKSLDAREALRGSARGGGVGGRARRKGGTKWRRNPLKRFDSGMELAHREPLYRPGENAAWRSAPRTRAPSGGRRRRLRTRSCWSQNFEATLNGVLIP